MPESTIESREAPKIQWKNFTVSVMSASSNENFYAVENARAVGMILPRMGMDGINGGYSVGGMGSFAEGYIATAREMGLPEDEIKTHLKGVVYSEKVIGKALAKQRGVNSPASITQADSLPERAGGIIKGSDVVIAVEGGVGTNIEALMAAQDEWFKERNQDNKLPTRPVILIEQTNMIEDTIALNEQRSPKTINTLTPHIYVLSGHSNPNIKKGPNDLDKATLANDPKMAEKLSMLLEYFYIKKEKDLGNVFDDQKYHQLELDLFSPESPNKVFTLKEKLQARQEVHGEGEGI